MGPVLDTDYVHGERKAIDAIIGRVKEQMNSRPEKGGRELALAHTKLQEAKMWMGKVLEELGSELPPQYADKA